MSNSEKNFVPQDFVYIGKAVDEKGKVFIIIRPLETDWTLGKRMSYEMKKWRDRIVGAVYTGASFSADGSIHALDTARFKNQWPNREERMEWQAKHEEVEVEIRNAKLEKDVDLIIDIEQILLPLRKTYENLRFQHDWAGQVALKKAVLHALKSAPLVIE